MSFPDKVMLVYISCPVQAFVLNTLRCYKCQACGHVAAVCRREGPRCAEGHETKECLALGKVVVYVNCRGAHGAGDQKYPV